MQSAAVRLRSNRPFFRCTLTAVVSPHLSFAHTAIATPTTVLTFQCQGGRTAWSSKVTIEGHSLSARYWYDGKYINNAKEDVAEVAYNWLMGGA